MKKNLVWILVLFIAIFTAGYLIGCNPATSPVGSSGIDNGGGGGTEGGPGSISLLAALHNASNSSIVFKSLVFGSDGYIYLTGSTKSTIEGDSNNFLGGDYDAFVAKYDLSGTKIWVKEFGTAFEEQSLGIAVDSNGSIYATGYTKGGLDGKTRTGYTDVFIVKYDSNGNRDTAWTKQFGASSSSCKGYGIAVDSSNNVFITGVANDNHFLLVKYDSNGNQYKKELVNSGQEGKALAVNNGYIYVTGYTSSTFEGYDISKADYTSSFFIAKYDTSNFSGSSTPVWVSTFVSTGEDSGGGAAKQGLYPQSLAVDTGNIYVTGNNHGSFEGQTPSNPERLDFSDIFVIKCNKSDGTKNWAKQIGARTGNSGGYGITVDSGNTFVTGFTFGTLDDTGSGGAFIIKYDSSGNKLGISGYNKHYTDYGYCLAINGNYTYVAGNSSYSVNGTSEAFISNAAK